MLDFDYIYKTDFIKMGKWNLLPLDSNGNWHSEETSHYFRKIFGFGKGTFIIQTLDDDMQHAYFPKFYVKKIYDFIKNTNQKDYKKLATTLEGFYKLRVKAQKEIPKTVKIKFKKLSNSKLLKVFLYNRDWAHKVTPYDQFGWLAEDYWNPVLEKILVNHGLKKGSGEFHRILFILTKPEEISTTLLEKRAVLEQAIRIKRNNVDTRQAGSRLAKQFGWMPVFTYGTPWDAEHYEQELKDLIKQKVDYLENEFIKLKNYKKIRNAESADVQKKYNFSVEDLQKFIDFGLALDARNEAEYLVSLCGFYVLPIYNEIAKRLYVSVKQLRNLMLQEVADCLKGKEDIHKVLQSKGKIIGWVFDRNMSHLKTLGPKEAANFFAYLNRNAKNLQGNDEAKGICASPGTALGKAKILHYPKDGNKVRAGDILIAHATTVDYLPAMKKAVAFVTEVGGLTCHAAVVAREFGVPAVVGLKNATKNFKDGDMVEVDANKGIVRKIK